MNLNRSSAAYAPGAILPRVIGHRGAAAVAPENTLASFDAAAAAGALWVELDVRLSRDRRCVVVHDATYARTTAVAVRVDELSAREARALDAGSWFDVKFQGVGIPTLDEALARISAAGMGVNIEIKETASRAQDAVRGVTDAMASSWPGDSPVPLLSSKNEAVLTTAGRWAPSLPRAIVFDGLPADWAVRAEDTDCASIHVRHTDLTEGTVAQMRETERRVAAFTVNDLDRARVLWSWGVDGVFSDNPAALITKMVDVA